MFKKIVKSYCMFREDKMGWSRSYIYKSDVKSYHRLNNNQPPTQGLDPRSPLRKERGSRPWVRGWISNNLNNLFFDNRPDVVDCGSSVNKFGQNTT
jgi:hypothetical protein